ncbi:MAG: L-histidine N(alpha)-methyltransferase [Pontimonas sp.]
MPAEPLSFSEGDQLRSWLSRTPPQIPPKWLYDQRGSELYEHITRLPEYYPTRTERGILTEHAAAIADVTQAKTVIELGAGSPEKSSILLRELGMRDSGHEFIPVDISTTYLEHIESSMAKTLPHVTVRPIQADFADRMPVTQGEPARLVLFLGGTLGNLDRLERAEFLSRVCAAIEPGDFFLLGVDLIKSRDRLIAAYYDRSGVTEKFIRNIVNVARKRWGATVFDEHFDYHASWVDEESRVEMSLVANQPTVMTIPSLDTTLSFEVGDRVLVETSHKFTRESITQEVLGSSLSVARAFSDAEGDFLVLLCTKG